VNIYPFIEAEKAGDHSVKRACALLEVSRAAYYAQRTDLGATDSQLNMRCVVGKTTYTAAARRGSPSAASSTSRSPPSAAERLSRVS
jgi:hypothetical protein